MRRETLSTWKKGILELLLLALLIFGSRSVIADWYHVPTGSMKPTIIEGDLVFVNRLSYDLKLPFTTLHMATWAEPQQGDVVVFYSPEDGQRLVKRVIGVPGDEVAMLGGRLYLNGEPLNYQAMDDDGVAKFVSQAVLFQEQLGEVRHPIAMMPERVAIRDLAPIKVPAGRYFMLGDNRDNSADSRYFGFVPRKLILGKAVKILASFDAENYYLPRHQRLLHELP